jgi:hypothetical protein
MRRILLCLLYGCAAANAFKSPIPNSPNSYVHMNGTDDVCIRTPSDIDVKYILDSSKTDPAKNYSQVDPKGIRTSRMALKLKAALEKLNINLKNRTVTDESSIGKMSKGTMGKVIRKIIERLQKANRHKSRSRRDVTHTAKVDKMLEPMNSLVRQIMSSLISRPPIKAYLNQQLNDKTSIISHLVGNESVRMEAISRLQQLNLAPPSLRSINKRRNEYANAEESETSLLLPKTEEDEEPKSCYICLNEVTSENHTLKLNCPHTGDFHKSVCI